MTFQIAGVADAIRRMLEDDMPISMTYDEYWVKGGRTLLIGYRDSAKRFGATMEKGRRVAEEIERLDREIAVSEEDLPL